MENKIIVLLMRYAFAANNDNQIKSLGHHLLLDEENYKHN